MASNDKLWFEIGVRDNVTNTLNTLLLKAEQLKSTLKDVSMAKGIYENALKVEQAFDKIEIALQRIKDARSKTTDPVQLDQLNKAETKLREMRREWKHLGNTQREMATKGAAALLSTRQGFTLAIEQVTRLTNKIDRASDAEIKGLDALKRKYYEVSNIRKTLGDSISNAVPGVDTTAAMDLYRKLISKEGIITRAINNGNAMPKSVQGADYDELLRQAKEAAKIIGVDTKSAYDKAAQSAQNLANANRGLMDSYYKVADAGKSTNRIMDQLRNQVSGYIGLYGLERMAKQIVTIGGQFEFQHIALQNILGDLQQANTLFAQLQEMAVESPKTFMELTSYTKQLSAYQIPYEELFDTTKRLADISTGLGVDMSRLILAYGQVRSAAVLRGQELRQFTEAGIPLVQKLADKFSELNGNAVTTGDVFELISKRAVPFKMVKEILWDMTDEGGQFFDMQSKLADTLYGKYQKLQDSWQIMLGRIADGENIMGKTFKAAIEGVVGLVNSIDTLMPALSMLMMGRLFHSGRTALGDTLDKMSGAAAIRNMEVAKLNEAVRLERERVMYGRELTAQEKQLVATRTQLTAREYALLAQAGELSRKKTEQLILDGKINRRTLMRLAIEQGITKEKIRQMSTSEVANAVGLFPGMATKGSFGKSVLGFMGGWFGVAMTSLGVLMSLYQRAGEQAERAAQASEAATSAMLQDLNSVNSLYNEMSKNRPSTEEGYASAVQRITDALKNSGNYSDEIKEQVEGTEVLSEKYVILYGQLQKVANEYLLMKDNVKAYLDEANRSGEGNIVTKIFNDNMVEDLSDWSKATIAKNVAKKGVDRYGAAIRSEIEALLKELGKWVESEMRGMNWDELFDLLSGGGKMTVSARVLKNVGEDAQEVLEKYKLSVKELVAAESEVDSQMQSYIDHLSVALEETLKAQGLDMSKIVEWKSDDLRKFDNSVNEIIGSYSLDGETARNFKEKVYNGLLSDPIKIKIKALPVVEKSELAPWQTDLKAYFDKNKINITIDAQTSMEKIEKDLQNKRSEWQEQMDRSGKILVKFGFDLSSLPDDINNALGKVPVWMMDYVRKAFSDYKEGKEGVGKIDQAGKDTGLNVIKSTKSGSGSKKDKVLEDWKNRISLLEKYRKNLGDLEKIMTHAEAEAKLREDDNYNALFEYFGNPEDYVASLNKAISAMGNMPKGDRKKFVEELGSKKEAENIRVLTEDTKNYVNELQRMMGVMSENYQTYKKWMDLTGDSKLAAGMAGVAINTNYSSYLRDEMEKALKAAGSGDTVDSVLGLDLTNAKAFGEESAIFKLWDAYRKEQERVRKEDMDELYNATKKLMTVDEEILAIEKQIQELRSKGATDNDSRVLAKQKELEAKQQEQFENSTPYLRFYSAIMSMTASEAETVGTAIKNNLVDQLAKGAINADKYLKSLKNIDTQLKTIRGKRDEFSVFAKSGIKGVMSQRQTQAEAELSSTTIQIQKLADEILDAKKAIGAAEKEGNDAAVLAAKMRLNIAEQEMERLKRVQEKEDDYLKKIIGDTKKLEGFTATLDLISSGIDGLSQAAQQMSDMFQALGQGGRAEGWSDAAGYISAIGSPIKSATNALKSAMSGDVGGIISNTVGIITSPITALANLHDKKLDRAIQKSQREVKKLGIEYSEIEKKMQTVLGGIYQTGGYKEMLANLQQQRKELQRQYDLEEDKKDSDADKLMDYKQQIKEMDDTIKNFAKDFANAIYGIDVSSWAKELTNAVVDAWVKGEDAAEAFHDKVKDIVKDLTTNILTQKIMEAALQPVLDTIVGEITAKKGKLDEGSVERFAREIDERGGAAVESIVAMLDHLKERGWDLSEETEKSTSSGSTISKSITEDTEGLLVSYLNAIRADVSVDRVTLTQILYAVQGTAEMPIIARAQLENLQQIASNTSRNADAAEKIYELFHKVAPDGTKVKVA